MINSKRSQYKNFRVVYFMVWRWPSPSAHRAWHSRLTTVMKEVAQLWVLTVAFCCIWLFKEAGKRLLFRETIIGTKRNFLRTHEKWNRLRFMWLLTLVNGLWWYRAFWSWTAITEAWQLILFAKTNIINLDKFDYLWCFSYFLRNKFR